MWLKYYFVLKRKNSFKLGLNAAKNTHQIKKASNKSCLKLNFLQKSPRVHMSTSFQSAGRRLQRSVCLKSYNVQKWEIRFTLGLNTAKNTH